MQFSYSPPFRRHAARWPQFSGALLLRLATPLSIRILVIQVFCSCNGKSSVFAEKSEYLLLYSFFSFFEQKVEKIEIIFLSPADYSVCARQKYSGTKPAVSPAPVWSIGSQLGKLQEFNCGFQSSFTTGKFFTLRFMKSSFCRNRHPLAALF